MTERMFNSDQEDYMRSLSETHPSRLCYCGWHGVGSCNTYHDRRTSLDKLNDWLAKPCVCPSYCEHCRAKKAIAYWNEKDAQPAPLTDEQRAREWRTSHVASTSDESYIDMRQLDSLLASYKRDTWIPVSERLPEMGEICWVVYNGTVQHVAYRRGFAHSGSYAWYPPECIDSDPIPDKEVTHWQPIPVLSQHRPGVPVHPADCGWTNKE